MIKLFSNTLQAIFSEQNGALFSLKYSGQEQLKDGRELFTLGLRGNDGSMTTLFSSNFRFRFQQEGELLSFHYDAVKNFPDLSVKVVIRAEIGGLFFCPSVSNILEEYWLEWLELPQVMLSGTGKVFLPVHEGLLLDEPMKYADYSEPEWHYYNHYPGWMQMQFMACFSGENGLYFGAHDLSHGTKALICKPEENNSLRMTFRVFCGSSSVGQYKADYDIVIKPFTGDWMEACEIYRDWVKDDPGLPEKGKFPQLIDESPVVLIYPVRGDGDDKGEMAPNEYYPYANAMPVVRDYAGKFESSIMPLLMHWEGTAPWAPPYVWPPLGGEDLLADFRDQLHAAGHYLGVYCSGTAWTQKSCIQKDYSREEQCRTQGLEKEMIRGPHGEIDAYICNGPDNQRIGYDMCISQKWVRETVINEVRKLADFGLDYAQFFDQNIGGASHLCWSREHEHPPVPGAWQTENMLSLLKTLSDDIQARGSAMLLGCEAAAGDAYIRYLPFNDLRYGCWDFSKGRPVPAYAFVFHEYINNFMGNQCGIHWQINFDKSPENLLYRTAYAFNAGDLLSVVLKDKGEIHWGWISKWDVPPPEQQSIITLINNLNSMRKKYPEFLQYGKMLKPLVALQGESWTITTTTGDREMDAFLHSTWQSPDGRIAQIVTNFMPYSQTIRVIPKAGSIVMVDGVSHSSEFSLLMMPLSAEIIHGKSYVAVTGDIGDVNDWHPGGRSKEYIATRLSNLALKYLYGKKELKADFPRCEKFAPKGNKLVLTFKYAEKFHSSDGKAIRHFEVAGPDGKYYPAKVEISGNKIILSSDKVANPLNARYCWSNVAVPNLYNEVNLPPISFRTSK